MSGGMQECVEKSKTRRAIEGWGGTNLYIQVKGVISPLKKRKVWTGRGRRRGDRGV